MRNPLLPIALAAALLGGCATVTNPVTGQRELTVMDERSEIEAGRKAHEEVLKEYRVYDNPRLQAYVNTLGQTLARGSQRSQLDWHFTVLDSTEVNAFALPGGYVYVTRGLMAYLEDEAELAGVIGHEIGHVTARHGAQRATRQQTAGIGVIAATILGAVLEARGASGATDLASTLSQGVAAGYIASYSREQESQADQLGAEYLASSNYDPKSMIEVIGVLKSQEQFAADAARAAGRPAPAGGGWLASHPSNDKRLQDIAQYATRFKGKYGDDGRARYLQVMDGVTFGDSREDGVVRGQNFYHEPLGIALTAPAGWSLRNASDALYLTNAAGDAGLIVYVAPAKAGATPEEIVRNLKLEQGRSERLTLGGLPAIHFAGTARDQQGRSQAVEATVVAGPGGRNFMLFYGARDAQALQRARAGMREAEATFRPLTAADRAAARPWVLKTAPFPRGGFAELARRSPLGAGAEAQLRLLNGAYPRGEPAVGQPVKIVE
ncbi:MAG TPA: M48 family metalloprotease [Candidatus Desulfobacillus sp.]|nr:M48 family metalloprotease [Candidatus Desulfobacillus sp.]